MNGINGSSVLLLIKDGGAYVKVGSQRGVKFDEKAAAMDFSTKDAREMAEDALA